MRTVLLVALVFLVPFLLVLVLMAHAATDESPSSVRTAEAQTTNLDLLFPIPSSTTTTTPPPPVVRQHNATRTTAPTERTPAAVGPVVDLIRAGFARFGAQVAEQAVRVASCESRLDPRATNGQHASLFQISRTYHEARARRLGFPWARMWEPEVNVAVAADIYASSGWQPWTCRRAA